MNRTKTLERTGLLDETFDGLMFCTFNMPHIHEIDMDALIKDWEAKGHKLGTFKGMDRERPASQARRFSNPVSRP